ncbi:hypothetical protein PGH47_42675 (plasmid) [Streptomyces sp. HUAS 31]|uniref:hypothetical protein n=1 Tax=Streptomyces sp. HUAS 31 TaxID=3020055 RepID=UPI002306A0D5|nr:hypothetical protein [Streptomyces sp. HUAS 31]WCE02454.1 hypothetical protein PGH47_42675 [Streptomyces sp. HUAS 31]
MSTTLVLAVLTAGLAMAGIPGTAAAAPVDPDGLNLRQWMGQIRDVIGDRPLNKIVMPGSHDAGSWSITDKTGICDTASEAEMSKISPQVAAAISVTQMTPIKEQLNSGSRYLDLRLCKQNGKWYTYHGGPLGGLFFDDPATGRKGEINDIAEWIRDHPDEIVTIELRTSVPPDSDPSPERDTAVEDHMEAVRLLGDKIGTSRMADRDKLSPTSTYNQFRAAGANVILLDTRNRTDYPWMWPAGSRMEGRNSYVENEDWGALFKEAFKNPTASNSTIDLISRTALQRNDEVLKNDMGDPGKFFVLSGNVDSTLAIPDAAFDVVTNGMDYKPDGLPYMLYLAREHNINLLQKLEGEWRKSYIAKNTNVVQLDWIDMGGKRDDGTIIGSGDMSAAIIANNTPTTATGTLVGTERRADGSWSSAEALPGANGGPEFAGAEQSVTAMPDGSLQYLTYGNDKRMYHNIRRADGSWQGWRRMNTDEGDKRFNGGPIALASTPNGETQAVAVDKDGVLLHQLRRTDGTWTGWAAPPGPDNGVFKAKDVAITGTANNSLMVLAYDKSGNMRLTGRWASGTWDTTGWTTLPGVGGAATFAGSDLSITQTPNRSLQIAAVGLDGKIWHMTRDGMLRNSPWTNPEWAPNDAMRATGVAIAGLPDGTAQLLAVGMDGNTWHALRSASGSWTRFGAVSGPYGRALGATNVRIAGLPDGRTYSLVNAR